MKNLIIIGNEKISHSKSFFSANIDFKTIVEGLLPLFNIRLIARLSKKKETFLINHDDIYLASNVIIYLINILKSFTHSLISLYILSEMAFHFCTIGIGSFFYVNLLTISFFFALVGKLYFLNFFALLTA